MKHPEKLLNRLDEIGQSLEKTGKALALIGLGSVGQELDRLDDYSDLDFFVIVEPGQKSHFLTNLDWLSGLAPIAYYFQNTVDGYKLLFADGVFCEFAVFEEAELAHIPFAPGRIVWKRAGVSEEIAAPVKPSSPSTHSVEWLVGELLTNLYVGMGRYRRGEKLSAFQFVQVYALGRLVDLAGQIEMAQPGHADIFVGERRFEQRFPELAQHLPQFGPGYEGTPAAANAILRFLDQHFPINPAIKEAILSLTGSHL
ncbi:MAG: hypothetical protein IPL78_14480 [Chloroflexi bacterium]|nr:hypothetical protein [Chloroflexota bacterium]